MSKSNVSPMREHVLSYKEREKRKTTLTEAVKDALDAGHYYIIIVSYAGGKVHEMISEFCTFKEMMATLSKLNEEALIHLLGGKHDCKGCDKKDTCDLPQRKQWSD